MNRSFKSVFNLRIDAWQFASEKVRNAGKTGSKANKPLLAMVLGLSTGTVMAQATIDGGTSQNVSGTQWDTGGTLVVGRNSTGQLYVENGGEVSNTNSYIGLFTGSRGDVFVNGPSSRWTTTGTLEIGYEGQAVLVIENGGTVINTGGTGFAADSSSMAQLNLNGSSSARGMLSTTYLFRGLGAALFQWNGGVLQARSNETEFLPNFVNGDIEIGSQGAYFDTQAYNVGMQTAGVLAGVGGLTKLGSGTLTIAGGNTYSGNTTVSSGTLKFDSYTQSASQTLGIGVTNHGNYGKLNVTGTATFNTNAKLHVEVASVPTLANGAILSDVIRAGTLNTHGFTVTDNSALFNFETIENANSVDLRVGVSSSNGILDAVNGHRHWSAAGAAKVLDTQVSNGATGDMGTVVTALGQLSNNRDLSRAATQTLPLISGNQAIQGTLSTFQKLVQNRNGMSAGASGLSSGDALSNKNGWGKIFGSRAEQDDRGGASGFKADTWGLALGGDAEVAPGARFGVAYAYAKTSVEGNTNISGSAQNANIDSHILSAYGSKDIGGNRTFSFQADVGVSQNKSTRYIDFGGLNRTARADYRTYSTHIGAAISQNFDLDSKTTLTPALRADYTWLKSQGYNESGADALNLGVASNRTDAFVIGADTFLQHRFSDVSRLDANLGVGYDAINETGNILATYAGAPGQSFMTTGIDHSPWLVRGGIGYSAIVANGTEVSFRYDAEGRSDYLNHTASARAKWAF
ncbi:autotransporter outer membrane beta-barrel domain-containing protein [Herminiimonas sp. KBW02]|uniref:autotransporter domain-containing protein n=1 Tax=Herminiimonas sp. KBW02 TaxID=2153363 RepID=UPI000F5B1876|nr:autotransporter domain-containing protein [Herminiimonas sp. KBW02]RQO33539.1 autotransporter outer membrane beta-barrel domain-containing protein [Herminiimonas sp. KBW02]